MNNMAPECRAIERRLAKLTGNVYTVHSCLPADSGHANTTWVLDSGPVPLVIKVQSQPSVVFERDPAFEPTVLRALGPTPIPVPEVYAVDADTTLFGAPWFAMELVQGRSLPDDPETSYMASGWFAESKPSLRTKVWNGFVDHLASLHSLASDFDPSVQRGGKHTLVLDYFEAALRDGSAGSAATPRQDEAIIWLRENAPIGADDLSTLCMGDARLANLLERNGKVVGLLDWELAYIGNPCGDVGFHLYMDGRYSAAAKSRLPGLPSKEATWTRWEARSGLTVVDTAYWEVFGALVMSVTATRALRQLVAAGTYPTAVTAEEFNPFATDLGHMTNA